jgi:hypothetical protein
LPGAKPAGDKITVAADALFDFDKATLRPEGKKPSWTKWLPRPRRSSLK